MSNKATIHLRQMKRNAVYSNVNKTLETCARDAESKTVDRLQLRQYTYVRYVKRYKHVLNRQRI